MSTAQTDHLSESLTRSATRVEHRETLAALLAEAGVASEHELRLAAAEGMETGERLGEIVLRRGWTDESGLACVLAKQWNLSFVPAEALPAADDVEVICESGSSFGGACSIGLDSGRPVVAVADPSEDLFASVRSALGEHVLFVVVTPSTLEHLLAHGLRVESKAPSADVQELQSLLADLDAAATHLGRLRDGIAEFSDRFRSAESELDRSRQELATAMAKRATDEAKITSLSAELAQQKDLFANVKGRLTDVLGTLNH